MLPSMNSTALVLVARPDTPVMLRWAASGPSRKSQSRNTGAVESARCVEPHRNAGRALATGVAVHPERQDHVGVGGEPDRPQRHRLERLFRHLPEHGGSEEPDLGPGGGLGPGGDGITVGADDRVHGRHQIGVGEPIGHHAKDHPAVFLDPHDGADADWRLAGGPEMELVGSRGLELGGHDAAERGSFLGHKEKYALVKRER